MMHFSAFLVLYVRIYNIMRLTLFPYHYHFHTSYSHGFADYGNHADEEMLENFRIPFCVMGPGVTPGADLAEINAQANGGIVIDPGVSRGESLRSRHPEQLQRCSGRGLFGHPHQQWSILQPLPGCGRPRPATSSGGHDTLCACRGVASSSPNKLSDNRGHLRRMQLGCEKAGAGRVSLRSNHIRW